MWSIARAYILCIRMDRDRGQGLVKSHVRVTYPLKVTYAVLPVTSDQNHLPEQTAMQTKYLALLQGCLLYSL